MEGGILPVTGGLSGFPVWKAAYFQSFGSLGFFTEGDFSGCSYRPPWTLLSGVHTL